MLENPYGKSGVFQENSRSIKSADVKILFAHEHTPAAVGLKRIWRIDWGFVVFHIPKSSLYILCVRAVHLNLLFNPCGPHVMTNQLLRYFFAFVCSFILIHICSSFFHWICLQFDKLMAWLMDFTIFQQQQQHLHMNHNEWFFILGTHFDTQKKKK